MRGKRALLREIAGHLEKLAAVEVERLRVEVEAGRALLHIADKANSIAASLVTANHLQQTANDQAAESLKAAEQKAAQAQDALQPIVEVLTSALQNALNAPSARKAQVEVSHVAAAGQ